MDLSTTFGIKPIGQQSVVWSVIDQLTNAMIEGKLKPGDKIPTETELAESFQVSRNSVREAIKILIAFGFLEIKRADGTYIRQGLSKQMLNPLVYGIVFSQGDSYRQLKEFRQLVEVSCMYMAIKYKTPEKLDELRESYERLMKIYKRKNPSIDQVVKYDMDFHLTIASMGDNLILLEVSKLLMTLTTSKRYEVVSNLLENDIPYLIKSHTEYYEAVLNGNENTTLDDLRKIARPDYYGD